MSTKKSSMTSFFWAMLFPRVTDILPARGDASVGFETHDYYNFVLVATSIFLNRNERTIS